MKKILIVILATAVISSCNKDNQLQDLKKEVVGKWEIERYSCGECTTPVTIYPEGNGNSIVFYNNGVFERRIADSITFSGRYNLSKNNICGTPNSDIALSTTEIPNAVTNLVQVASNKLQLSKPYCYADGSVTIYRRIQ